MTESTFQPNWASPPGETIAAILRARAIPLHQFCVLIGLEEQQTLGLLQGQHPIDSKLAIRISASVGSTPRFWIERERKFQSNLRALETCRPALEQWFRTFPIARMREMGWIPRVKTQTEAPFELLDFFGVSTIEQWKERYVGCLERIRFRTSEAFENSVPATTAWLRRGELVADEMSCRSWNRRNFQKCLLRLKPLSTKSDPRIFLPELQMECAKHGVAVVVERCPSGCAASGATVMLESKRALLLLSARFLSDDHFWFSFFHEAGHLVLHGEELNIEEAGSFLPEREAEANEFAQGIILDPEGEEALKSVPINKFAIARLARRCNVSKGIIVGQLQNGNRLPKTSFNWFKNRYKVADFTPENELG
jgi:Zn-dependent peptidase ImmA (M78 family)/plasmid maintenance system antidote protein VapI